MGALPSSPVYFYKGENNRITGRDGLALALFAIWVVVTAATFGGAHLHDWWFWVLLALGAAIVHLMPRDVGVRKGNRQSSSSG
jgi:hypothetical protein